MGRVLLTVFLALALLAAGVWFLFLYNGPLPQTVVFSYKNATANDITIYAPTPGTTLTNTFTIDGNARGPWYFEASFPIRIQKPDGSTLLETYATAEGEWMTTDFVPFSVDIAIPGGYKGDATVVLKNDNPSGLLENEKSVSFFVTIQ